MTSLARLHYSEKGLRQDFGGDVLGLAVRLDQCGEPEVGCRTDRGHNGRAFRRRCSCRHQAGARCSAKSKCDNREKACPAQNLRVNCGDLAAELSPLSDEANIRQREIVELLEFANITAKASLSGWATRQLGASQDDNAEPFRQRAQDVVHANPDNETALDAGLPLDFEKQQRDGIVFLGHSKLLRGRARSIRSHGSGQGVLKSRRDVRLEAHLQPVLNISGDFLEIFSEWYIATVPIVAGYLTKLPRRSFELPRRPFPCDASRKIEKSGLSGGARQTHRED